LKNIVRSAVLAAAFVAMAGCTDATKLLNALPTGANATGTGTTPTTNASTAPNTTTTTTTTNTTSTPAPKPTASVDIANTTAAQCSRTSPSGTPDLLDGSSYGKFNGQHVPNGWASAYSTEKQVWDAINSNSSLKPEDWACFQKFYPGATQVWKDLIDKYGN
jgi:hypothetical protein